MNPALIVLNPRHIPECLEAIAALEIPTCWLSYMNEPSAAACGNAQIEATSFSHYVILSDDTIPTQGALDLVLSHLDEHPVVTGYCNMDQNDFKGLVNLTNNRLPPPPPQPAYYRLSSKAVLDTTTIPVVRTTFAGLALTAMSRELWLTFPLRTTVFGGQMDYDLSYRLQQASVPIVAAVGAYVEHVKERWNHPDQNPQKRLLVGERTPKVRWSNVEAMA